MTSPAAFAESKTGMPAEVATIACAVTISFGRVKSAMARSRLSWGQRCIARTFRCGEGHRSLGPLLRQPDTPAIGRGSSFTFGSVPFPKLSS